MASLGTKLLNLRRQHRLSQTEIAEVLDVSQNAYNKWEADKDLGLCRDLMVLFPEFITSI